MTLDLEDGDPERAEMSSAERRRAARASTSGESKSSSSRPTSEAKEDSGIAARLDRTFDRIAKALEARDDDELAEIIREDSKAMGQGLVSLTHSVKFLRNPLIIFLNLAEPLLAFGRVGRVLFRRLMERRERALYEQQQWQESNPDVVNPEAPIAGP